MRQDGLSLKGMYRDTLIGADGRVLLETGWIANTIVDTCRVAIAQFMRGDGKVTVTGIQYLAVGKGKDTWEKNLEVPQPGDEDLVNPVKEHVSLAKSEAPADESRIELAYLGDRGQPSDDPTSRLRVTATLAKGFPEPEGGLRSYPLREFGLFGERKTGSGPIKVIKPYMINCVHHQRIDKVVDSTLIREIHLYF